VKNVLSVRATNGIDGLGSIFNRRPTIVNRRQTIINRRPKIQNRRPKIDHRRVQRSIIAV
jgi:hypothetical protein